MLARIHLTLAAGLDDEGQLGTARDMRPPLLVWVEGAGAVVELEILVAQRRSDEHLLRHPLGRVPALQLGDGATMFESAAICLQLADLNPGAGLIGPVGSTGRGLVYQWVVFAVSELEGPLFRWIRELGEGVVDSPARDRFADAGRRDAVGARRARVARRGSFQRCRCDVRERASGSQRARAAGTVGGTRGLRAAR